MQKMKSIALNLLVFLYSFSSVFAQIQDPIPQYETFNIESKKVNETRVINVWTPPQYKEGSEKFPVLYMPDGGIKEDFPHIANTLSELISTKKIPPFILVGIENTERKRDLTGFTNSDYDKKMVPINGGSENFRAFINDELFPEINKRYRTTNDKGIIGESLAGLFVVETLFLKPEMFNFYIAMDPSLWWNDQHLLKTFPEHLKKISESGNIKFWFAGSSAKDISGSTKSLGKNLEKANLPNLKWNFSPEPKEKHNTIFRATKEKALIWTLNN